MKKIKENHDEKIIIDNDGAPFKYTWDGNCTNIDLFLDRHLFPLITIINENYFFYSLYKRKKLLVMLFGFLINNKTTDFINKEYKHLAYINNKFIFCFLNYTNTSEINRYFGVKLYSHSEIKLIIFDYSKSVYYIHPMFYDVNYNSPEEIYNDYNKILSNLSEIKFTTGYLFKDLMYKFGFKEFTTSLSIALILTIILMTVLISFTCLAFCNRFCPSEIDENEKIEPLEENKNNNLNKQKNKENKPNKDNENKLKKE